MNTRKIRNICLCILVAVIALIWCFPIIYMVVSSFKPESQVGVFGFVFQPTLENYQTVITPAFFDYLKNSLIVTVLTVIFSTLLAVPAGYGLAFATMKKPDNMYFWFVSTTFLPAIAVITPVYLIFNALHLVDSIWALVILYTGAGVPMMVWLVTNYFREIPKELVEAATVDGANKIQTFFKIMIPLIKNGVVSSALLVFILTWNEFFFAITITYSESATLPVYMSKWMTQQGYFWGKMCASGTLIVLIPIILGFFAQKSLVKGLTSGSVKG
ncbi:Inner membrane ABC transporter permease protein ycjP [uncultured Roseburia sp.]|uniref:Carbohydrate ABC transporter permease n=1 Tax=Brotonthovivens ammoniilytica TaxID=2981725 RepID=A0ABT2TJE6_9FIRM|nr:carbohydrate ABC transporter permease [Brotonthovivens ammoniilytica]MCU6762339.1 carbohydrate ABC transporter permease [Brotonthovivens ammoniilytica]SCI68506.1 Inner membrane ABC transporter permease protein ycjP [uncultured Roseburia sp.]